MARIKTDQLNAYYLLLIQKTLLIIFDGFLIENVSRKKFYEEVGVELNTDPAVIKKFFNDSHNKNTPSFRKALLDRIVQRLSIDKISTWDIFKTTYIAPSQKENPKDFLPIGHFEDLSAMRQKQIFTDVEKVLLEIFPEVDSLNLLPAPSSTTLIASKKLEFLFYNTCWYIYLIVKEFGVHRIVRSVLRIGSTVDSVETEGVKIAGANDFSGTIEFDENESYLIFNLKAKYTNERWIHIKADVNTGSRPGIILGQYQNIGIGGRYLHFSNIILEYIEDKNVDSAYPVFFDASDLNFLKVPAPIQLFLRDAKQNYTELPTRIYSLESLQQYVESSQFEQDSKQCYIRVQKDFKAFIGHPFGRLTPERGIEYRNAFLEIKESFSQKGIEVHEEVSHDFKMSLNSAYGTDQYLRWVTDCDVFVLLYFDEVVTNSLNELAWAFHAKLPIIILTCREPILPSMYKPNSLITIFWLKDLDEAVSWLKNFFNHFLNIRYGIKINLSESQ